MRRVPGATTRRFGAGCPALPGATTRRFGAVVLVKTFRRHHALKTPSRATPPSAFRLLCALCVNSAPSAFPPSRLPATPPSPIAYCRPPSPSGNTSPLSTVTPTNTTNVIPKSTNASVKSPNPHAIPRLAATQMLAAVVNPRT